MLASMAFPEGIRLSEKPQRHVTHSFVLTDMELRRLYGYCLRVPCELHVEQLRALKLVSAPHLSVRPAPVR
jgi:hypothetical protein